MYVPAVPNWVLPWHVSRTGLSVGHHSLFSGGEGRSVLKRSQHLKLIVLVVQNKAFFAAYVQKQQPSPLKLPDLPS